MLVSSRVVLPDTKGLIDRLIQCGTVTGTNTRRWGFLGTTSEAAYHADREVGETENNHSSTAGQAGLTHGVAEQKTFCKEHGLSRAGSATPPNCPTKVTSPLPGGWQCSPSRLAFF